MAQNDGWFLTWIRRGRAPSGRLGVGVFGFGERPASDQPEKDAHGRPAEVREDGDSAETG